MDTAQFWLMLLCVCVCGSCISSLAVDCDWTTQYDHGTRCCKACPSGEYPKEPCSESSDGVCEKCPPDTTKLSLRESCFCKDKHYCLDENECNKCTLRERCSPGKYLKRHGKFDYRFQCKECPNGTYNDAEDSSCKNITKCDGVGEIFPGNQTHDSICATTVADPKKEAPDVTHSSHSFMVACLTVTALICLVMIIYVAFQIFKYKMLIKLNKPCTHNIQYTSDSCACKLSKEEMGEEHYIKTTILEDSFEV